MPSYTIGDQFEFETREIRIDKNGKEYIAVYDKDADAERRIYNILKCQREEGLPETIFAVVAQVDVMGKVKFKQDETRLFKEHYKEGHYYRFHVNGLKEDYNTHVKFYAIEDDFAEHNYYFKGEPKYHAGDDCILEISGFNNKGRLQFKEHETLIEGEVVSTSIEETSPSENEPTLYNEPILQVGDEDMWTEYKTSIAFPPGNHGEADIDKQLFNIMKELTAFMNAEGGTLYIGVHDKSKRVVGIQRDFRHLNEGENDDYNGTYNESTDSYQLKIRNAIGRSCTGVANSLINIEFPELQGVVYCIITVKKAQRPIWLNGNLLFVRQGNRIRLMKDDEITFFISDLMTYTIQQKIEVEEKQISMPQLNKDDLKDVIVSILNETKAPSIPLPPPPSLDEVDYWITWYNNKTWMRSRSKVEEDDVFWSLPVPKKISDPVVVFCYENGKVNTVKLSEFRKRVNLNKLQKNGWSRTDNPICIFLALQTDFLVGYSLNHNGIKSVKLHALTDFTPTQSAGNQGSPFVPDGDKMSAFGIIGAEHKSKVAHLIGSKGKRSSEAGIPLSSASFKSEIEYLEMTLKGPQ